VAMVRVPWDPTCVTARARRAARYADLGAGGKPHSKATAAAAAATAAATPTAATTAASAG